MKTPPTPKGPTPQRKLFQRSLVLLLGIALFALLLSACTRDRPIEGNVATPSGAQVTVLPTSTPAPAVAGEPSVVNVISDTTSLDGTPAPTVEGEVAGETIQEYTVQSGDTLLSIASEFGMGVEDLKSLNLLKSDAIAVGQPLQVRVTPPTPTPTPEPFLYTVQAGDSLGGIAAQFGVSQVDIINANKLVDPNAVPAGKELLIPGFAPETASSDASGETASGATSAEGNVTHTVKVGETLGEIARDFGVTISDLVAANNIANPNSVRVGTELTIPGVSAQEFADANAVHHTVAAGESLSVIAQQYGITTAQLMAANNIVNNDTIRVGQDLIVPQP